MITKKLFIKCINDYQKYLDYEDKLAALGINIWERDELATVLSNMIELLENACKDPADDYEGSNITYFIYDTEFGKHADKYFITEQDGTEVHFYTAEDLWNYLVKQHPEIEGKNEESIFEDDLK